MKRISLVALILILGLLTTGATAAAQTAPETTAAALAEHYAGEAARHAVMARALAGNPNRTSAVAPGAHCARLARLYTTMAARGEAAPLPQDGTREATRRPWNFRFGAR